MSSVSSQQIFYINSSMRTAGESGNFSYQVQLPPNSNFDRVCVLQANIPISYYIVPAAFNTLTLVEGPAHITITVPPGNYTANTFASAVATLLTSSSLNTWVYNIVLSTLTGKFLFSVSGNGSSQPSFILGTNLYEQFGFNSNTSF